MSKETWGGGGGGGIDKEIFRGENRRKSKETWWRYRQRCSGERQGEGIKREGGWRYKQRDAQGRDRMRSK